MAQTAPTETWTLKSNSYLGQITSDKNFPKVTKHFMKETSKKWSKTTPNNIAGSYIYSGDKLRHVLLCGKISACLDAISNAKDYMLANFSRGFVL